MRAAPCVSCMRTCELQGWIPAASPSLPRESVPAPLTPPASELSAAAAALSVEQLRERIAELQHKSEAQAAKLAGLRGGGARVIAASDVAQVEKVREGQRWRGGWREGSG